MSNSNNEFTIKDSGARVNIGGGVRDTEENKVDYTLVRDGVMYRRYAEHLTRGARKYAARNWLKFFATRESALAAFQRAGRSLLRHTEDYLAGIRHEDHAAAVIFNLDVRETALRKYPDLSDAEEIPCPDCDAPEDRIKSPKAFVYVFDGDEYEAIPGEIRAPIKGEVYLMLRPDGRNGSPWKAQVDSPQDWCRQILRKVNQ